MTHSEKYISQNFIKACLLAIISIAIILFGILLSISMGTLEIAFSEVLNSFFNYDLENNMHIIIRQSRMPRTFGAILIGSALAVSGAIMQGVTRNPIADTGVLGISAGATFALAIIMCYFPFVSYSTTVFASIIGSTFGAIFVYLLSNSTNSNSTAKLAIAGATLSGLLTALSQALAMSRNLTQNLAFWTFGSISTITYDKLAYISPVILIALIVSISMSKQITIMSMGEDVAIGLGINISFVKATVLFLVVLLAGVSVALAGMISFVGLIVPHFIRGIVGPDYKYIIPLSAILGGFLLLYSDIISRTIVPNSEMPLGAIVAIIGVPTFLYIAKNNKGVGA
ncbi:MAG: FecCD family ABC transporter permease [Lachnospirales bacterium]